MILAADVGATKTLLGLFREDGAGLRSVGEASFSSEESGSLEEIVEEFLARRPERVRRCAVGVAGPVIGGRSQVVNLKWPVDARKLARKLDLPSVHLLNDLEATAWGIPALPPGRLAGLTRGLRRRARTAALIAAGTGLGMAILVWDGERHVPSSSEGGHQGFAPRGPEEIALLEYLERRHGRVSVERVVSGPGLAAIYDFLVESGRAGESAAMRRRLARTDDRSALISSAGAAGEDDVAERALAMFVSIYGAAAGDLALAARATGGVYVGGGIAPKILPRLSDGDFLRAFRAKGRLTPLVEKIPVRVILEPRTALLGAAVYAARGVTPPGPPRSGPLRPAAPG